MTPPWLEPLYPTPPHDIDQLGAQADLPALDLPEEFDDQPLPHEEHDDHDPPPLPYPALHLHQPAYGQKDYLRAGEAIVLVQNTMWVKMIFSSHTGHMDAKHGSLYWNYAAPNGSHPTGGYLFPGESWGVLRGADAAVDLSQVEIVLPGQQPADIVGSATESDSSAVTDTDSDIGGAN